MAEFKRRPILSVRLDLFEQVLQRIEHDPRGVPLPENPIGVLYEHLRNIGSSSLF